MIHHEGLRRFIALLMLAFTIGISMAGCDGGHSSDKPTPTPSSPAQDPVNVQITVDGSTFTYNKGPVQKEGTSFTGIASGCQISVDTPPHLMLYASLSEASGQIFDSDVICLQIDAKGATAIGTYTGVFEGQWRKDASNVYVLSCTQITIEEYGAVGGRIKGTFIGTCVPKDDESGNTKAFTGSFNVQRFPDDDILAYAL